MPALYTRPPWTRSRRSSGSGRSRRNGPERRRPHGSCSRTEAARPGARAARTASSSRTTGSTGTATRSCGTGCARRFLARSARARPSSSSRARSRCHASARAAGHPCARGPDRSREPRARGSGCGVRAEARARRDTAVLPFSDLPRVGARGCNERIRAGRRPRRRDSRSGLPIGGITRPRTAPPPRRRSIPPANGSR